MAGALSAAVQAALAAGRERLNARFAAARRGTDLDPAAFRSWIRDGIAPAVDAAAARDPQHASPVLEALFELSLPLTVQRVLGAGAREPAVSDGWKQLLPALPGLLAREPAALAATVVNALHRLAATEGARPEEWTAAMLRAGVLCPDVPAFRDAGLIAAWRAGLAQFRAPALALARRLDPALVVSLLRLDDVDAATLPALLDGAAADPWRTLEELHEGPWGEPRLALVARVGSFRGFGGFFPVPPRVEAHAHALYARAGAGCWRLFADCYGSAFLPAALPPAVPRPQDATVFAVDTAGTVRHRGLSESFPQLAAPTSAASDGVTLAVTTATSHAAFLVARR